PCRHCVAHREPPPELNGSLNADASRLIGFHTMRNQLLQKMRASSIRDYVLMRTDDAIGLMPDVAAQTQPYLGAALDWVGMDGIEMSVRFDAGDGDVQRSSARVGAFVNLTRPDRRGIHMSRLYLLMDEYL